jgi:hypothetical protein
MLVGGIAVVSGLSFWGQLAPLPRNFAGNRRSTITATVGAIGAAGQVSMRMVYGLRVPNGAVVSAIRFDLVRLPDRGRLPRRRRDLDRRTGTPHSLWRSASLCRLRAIVAIIGYDR